ncbi:MULTISPECIES: response regulator transcription factor [Cobetia]|uniref:Response regulator transcription factor n=1 Tax=Cobetia crustatorum TaxID=553385 RepID=A0A558HJI8_9GAMM|nr:MULTISPECIES: response regulator transcription factor [Cobetia]TVU69299.1 response regulator transcription factor [Cobetia crustatorum]
MTHPDPTPSPSSSSAPVETTRLLLVEDDALLSSTLCSVFEGDGLSVTHLANGSAALTLLADEEQHGFALILLDLNLPGASGLEILAALRQHDRHTPVLILTARGAIEDRVRGLDLGADDYLAKPFALDELEARVRALLRRHASLQPIGHSPRTAARLVIGSLAFEPLNARFLLADTPLALPPREQRLLGCLIQHAGEPVDKARLTEEAFGSHAAVGDNAIEVYVHRLRKRLEGSDVRLRTVRGLGYLLENTSPPSAAQAGAPAMDSPE